MQSTTAQHLSLPETSAVACPACSSTDLTDQGALPKCRKFAGRSITPYPGGKLYRCAGCALVFRFPSLAPAQYQALYEASENAYWRSDALRFDQQLLHAEIRRLLGDSGGSVLDIGCYDGALLASLPSQIEKYGIEPSSSAAQVAVDSGVQILGPSLEALMTTDQKFDLVCAVNVIEHVHNPMRMFRIMADHLKPGGHLLVSTGNASALSWRLLGPSFWYSANAEHISFISPEWSRQVAANAGLKVGKIVEFSYEALPLSKRLIFWAELATKASLAALERTVVASLSPEARRLGPRLGLGRQGMFKDHFYATFSHQATNQNS